MSSDATSLQERYGNQGQRRVRDRWIAIVGVAVVVIGVTTAVTIGGIGLRSTDISVTDLSQRMTSPNSMELEFAVTAAPGERVACAIEARSESHAPIGYRVLDLPPSAERNRTLTTELVTTGVPVHIQTKKCWIVQE